MVKDLTKGFQRKKIAWMTIQGFVLFVMLCILAGAGRILVLLFPLGSILVGVFLYQRHPVLYVGFTWWLWFLGPLARRLIDYQSGYLTYGPWTLTPQLVTFISLATLIRHLPKWMNQSGLPFILCFLSTLYGFIIGLLNNPANKVILGLLGWSTPILFGFHLLVNWRDFPSYRQTIQRTFLWGVWIMGVYGVWQYVLAPEWDRFWLLNIENTTFGEPEPFGIRMSSSMNSPQAFAATMMAGLILLFSTQGILRFPAAAVGYLTFLLSMARAAWLSWLGAMFIFVSSLKARLQMRLVITIILTALFVLPLAAVEPFSHIITHRIYSLLEISSDVSYQARLEGYQQLLSYAAAQFTGRGLGYSFQSDTIGLRDSSVLSMLFAVGWFGTVPYLSGVLLIFFKLFQGAEGGFDLFVGACRAIALGIFVQLGLNVVMEGPIGMILWGFMGIGMAANKYYCYQRIDRFVQFKRG